MQTIPSLDGLSFAELLDQSATPPDVIADAVAREDGVYKVSILRKRSGGERRIHIPNSDLMQFQRWILSRVLVDHQINSHAFAYVPGRSVVKCAEQHLGARWVLKMDLRSYFDWIDERSVYYLLLKRMAADKLLAFQLARALTWPDAALAPQIPKYATPYVSAYQSRYYAGYMPHQLGCLPQGAPTSGALANLISDPLDRKLAVLSRRHGLEYTRYSDDLYFSAVDDSLGHRAGVVIGEVAREVQRSGFFINRRKTRLSGPGSERRVLGLLVDGSSVRLPRGYRDRIDRHLWAMEKFGISQHSASLKHRDIRFLLAEVEGLLGFAKDVQPGWARTRERRFTGLLQENHIGRAAFSSELTGPKRFHRST